MFSCFLVFMFGILKKSKELDIGVVDGWLMGPLNCAEMLSCPHSCAKRCIKISKNKTFSFKRSKGRFIDR